jgi:hypothetical protein
MSGPCTTCEHRAGCANRCRNCGNHPVHPRGKQWRVCFTCSYPAWFWSNRSQKRHPSLLGRSSGTPQPGTRTSSSGSSRDPGTWEGPGVAALSSSWETLYYQEDRSLFTVRGVNVLQEQGCVPTDNQAHLHSRETTVL